MRGMTKPLGMFIKIMEIIFVIIALIAVFFTITNYEVIQISVLGTKEADNVMQGVLSAPCLTEEASDGYAIRGLFDADDIAAESVGTDNPSCLDYPTKIYIFFSDSALHGIGNSGVNPLKNVTYPAAIKRDSGQVDPITVTVFVE